MSYRTNRRQIVNFQVQCAFLNQPNSVDGLSKLNKEELKPKCLEWETIYMYVKQVSDGKCDETSANQEEFKK